MVVYFLCTFANTTNVKMSVLLHYRESIL